MEDFHEELSDDTGENQDEPSRDDDEDFVGFTHGESVVVLVFLAVRGKIVREYVEWVVKR